MRPRDPVPRERLLAALRRLGPCSPVALQQALDVPRSTLLRLLDEQAGALLAAGAGRRRRVAARRGLRGDVAGIPVHRVDAAGQVQSAGTLHLLEPDGCWWPLDAGVWPLPDAARDGWWTGLPLPIQDLRLQGYMGRQFARRHHVLRGLPADPRDWRDEDHLWALAQAGQDLPGDLILGEAALSGWLASAGDASTPPIDGDEPGPAYARLAEAAVATGIAGSSAAGEFPKFTARRRLAGAATPEVIVKFSGADDAPAVRRWADLLRCEHHALRTLAERSDLPVSRSRVRVHGGRTFLESERFDRIGERGRSPVVSLASLDSEALGLATSHWPALAQALVRLGWLTSDDARRVTRLHLYGRLIANSDMHTGNLAFQPEGGRLRLAPVYDMLPMRLAPLAGGEVPPLAAPELALPRPDEREDWAEAARWALSFWQTVADDALLGGPLRAFGEAQARLLRTRIDPA
ncbi:type II toxin-antitoxin system HipA family toxin YjjJ [Leptothrix discophora]|uniref:Type II toxin-antitoxin system HipA family toxin YjjJ n=1 Tax=Leptothrix discophora TaxID=89 RepID=A0ABT9FY95_LEPDI|nr:type II toxin-antitoxin system HipA family toxin YjjJ [Leptothrix discophora]MDP4299115.1 type II toxin-antitoxin system HipA family toxin YjjJ [Leptothrix discophora]